MTTAMPVRWQIGFDTDLGGGKENQDDCFIWSSPDDGICVIGVLDGHGREVGKVAANAAKSSLKEFFKMHFSELRTSPHDCLIRAHEVAHLAIKSKFRALYEDDGYEIMENSEGYLLKSMKGQQWSCIHGGSTCSICALVDGYLYTANVGDSTGILCSTHPVLTKADVSVTGDGAVSTEIRKKYTDSIIIDDSDHKDNCTSIIITAEHSPESPYEFLRLRDFRAKVDKPDLPALNVVYDSPAHEKAKCPQVFSIGEGRQPILTNKGW